MDSNTDGDNLNLSCGENDMTDELKIGADETYDTRSEVSSSGSDSDSTQPSISSVSTKSSRGDNKRNRRSRGKRARSRDSDKSSSPEPKRARSKESRGIAKNYDYTTKLNYLFRDARFDIQWFHYTITNIYVLNYGGHCQGKLWKWQFYQEMDEYPWNN